MSVASVFIVNFEQVSHIALVVSIVDFEQVNTGWVILNYQRKGVGGESFIKMTSKKWGWKMFLKNKGHFKQQQIGNKFCKL